MYKVPRFLALCFLFSCAHSYHEAATDVSLNATGRSGKLVKSRAEQFVILGFVQDTDYVERATRDLIAQCPIGVISPLTTKYYTSLGFFSWTNHLVLEGTCLP